MRKQPARTEKRRKQRTEDRRDTGPGTRQLDDEALRDVAGGTWAGGSGEWGGGSG